MAQRQNETRELAANAIVHVSHDALPFVGEHLLALEHAQLLVTLQKLLLRLLHSPLECRMAAFDFAGTLHVALCDGNHEGRDHRQTRQQGVLVVQCARQPHHHDVVRYEHDGHAQAAEHPPRAPARQSPCDGAEPPEHQRRDECKHDAQDRVALVDGGHQVAARSPPEQQQQWWNGQQQPAVQCGVPVHQPVHEPRAAEQDAEARAVDEQRPHLLGLRPLRPQDIDVAQAAESDQQYEPQEHAFPPQLQVDVQRECAEHEKQTVVDAEDVDAGERRPGPGPFQFVKRSNVNDVYDAAAGNRLGDDQNDFISPRFQVLTAQREQCRVIGIDRDRWFDRTGFAEVVPVQPCGETAVVGRDVEGEWLGGRLRQIELESHRTVRARVPARQFRKAAQRAERLPRVRIDVRNRVAVQCLRLYPRHDAALRCDRIQGRERAQREQRQREHGNQDSDGREGYGRHGAHSGILAAWAGNLDGRHAPMNMGSVSAVGRRFDSRQATNGLKRFGHPIPPAHAGGIGRERRTPTRLGEVSFQDLRQVFCRAGRDDAA